MRLHRPGERLQRLRPLWQSQPDAALEVGAKNPLRAGVCDGKRLGRIEHQHAGRKVRKNVLEPLFGRLERRAVSLHHAAGIIELPRHGVERFGEDAKLVPAGDRRLAAEVAARHRLCRLGETCQRLGQPACKDHGKGDRDEQRHGKRKRQRDDVDPLQLLPRKRKFPVVAVRCFDRLDAVAEQFRHRLAQLQEPGLIGKRRPADRHHHP